MASYNQGRLSELRVLNKACAAFSIIAVLVLASFIFYWHQPSSFRAPGG